MIKRIKKIKAGFTLIEVMVALSIFGIVMMISSGALMNIVNANRKAQSLRIAMDNLDSALETMSRNIRVGYAYRCADFDSPYSVKDCPDGVDNSSFTFKMAMANRVGVYQGVTYVNFRLNSGRIIRTMFNNTGFPVGGSIPITSPDELSIDSLNFIVKGTTPRSVGGDTIQPTVLISIKAHINGPASPVVPISIQTLITQRALDSVSR